MFDFKRLLWLCILCHSSHLPVLSEYRSGSEALSPVSNAAVFLGGGVNDFYFFPIIAGLECSVSFLLYSKVT